MNPVFIVDDFFYCSGFIVVEFSCFLLLRQGDFANLCTTLERELGSGGLGPPQIEEKLKDKHANKCRRSSRAYRRSSGSGSNSIRDRRRTKGRRRNEGEEEEKIL